MQKTELTIWSVFIQSLKPDNVYRMNLTELNSASKKNAEQAFTACCTASRWVDAMVATRPFMSLEALQAAADLHWQQMQEPDYLEAFDGHPKIGDPSSLKEKYGATRETARGEQSGVATASDAVLNELAVMNSRYLDKFGFIFIVCATGKSAQEMLELLQERYDNERTTELEIAAAEQGKITAIRITKNFEPDP